MAQVRKDGPDDDCMVDMGQETALDITNPEFMKFIQQGVRQVMLNPTAGVHTAFQIGVEVGLQYAKVSREVESLNKSL